MSGKEAWSEGCLAASPSDEADVNQTEQAQCTACVGCGLPTEDPERICQHCRHTDEVYGTNVSPHQVAE